MKTTWQFCLACIVLATHTAAVPESLNLLFVQILFRHGDRAPINLYPNDPNPETAWPEGLAQLTMLGKKEHYGLGKFFRSHYKDFMTSSPLEINVISSDAERCLKSAETNLAAFFKPSVEWQFDNNVDWQPISVHYIPENEDKYLETGSYCPRADLEKERVVNSPEGKKFIAKHKKMFDYLAEHSGKSITNWTSASYLHDVLWIEKRYNLTVPKWVDPYWDELEEVSALSFFWSFNSPLLHRLRAGPLLKRIIKKMNEKINEDIPHLKFQIYSAHDTNIAVILNSLNLFNMKQPPYCSTILFELYEGQSDSKFVRLLFLNSTEPEKGSQIPHVLVLEGCTEYCPLEYFINYTQPLIPGDWEKECQISNSFIDTVKGQEITIIVMIVALSIIISMTFVAVWRIYKVKRDKYAYHLMTMN